MPVVDNYVYTLAGNSPSVGFSAIYMMCSRQCFCDSALMLACPTKALLMAAILMTVNCTTEVNSCPCYNATVLHNGHGIHADNNMNLQGMPAHMQSYWTCNIQNPSTNVQPFYNKGNQGCGSYVILGHPAESLTQPLAVTCQSNS